MSSVLFSVWFSIQGIIQNTTYSIWFRIQRIIKKMSRVLLSVWFSIQRIIRCIIQNTTSVLFGVWSRIQGIIWKYPGCYSASSSVFSALFRELFKIRPAYYSAPGLGLRVLFKKNSRVLFSIWIIKKWLGYYSVSVSVFSMLTRLRFQRTQVKLMFMLHVLFYLAIAINSWITFIYRYRFSYGYMHQR